MPVETSLSVGQRVCYLPFRQAKAGMLLAAPLVVTEHGVMRINLPQGHVLTEINLEQLRVHHAELVCVLLPDTRSDAQKAVERAREESYLNKVFQLADRQQPLIKNLYQAVLNYRGL